MKVDEITISPDFHMRVTTMVDRLAPVRLVVPPRWVLFAERLGLGERSNAAAAANAVVVGPPATVLRHAATETRGFGFVMPVAQSARWWQRQPSWRDDATLDLWAAGWTPVAVDRMLVATPDAVLEFVIGNARRTPTNVDESTS